MAGHRFTKEEAAAAGRKRGKTKKNKEWENLGNFIIDAGAKKAMRILNEMDDDKFIEQYTKLVSYFKPKIVHNINEDKHPVRVIFENASDKFYFDKDGNSVEK